MNTRVGGETMKRVGVLLSVLIMVLGLSVSAQATLVDMGDGTIYDTDAQLSWLKNAGAGGTITWAAANTWASSLNISGLTGWRLPIADLTCNGNGGFGLNCTNSEMGHLYYTVLGNAAGGPLTNTGPFANLSTGGSWWSGTPSVQFPGFIAGFQFYRGYQNVMDQNGLGGAWAVRSGARALPAKPVPASRTAGLIILGLAGLIIVGMRLRRATR